MMERYTYLAHHGVKGQKWGVRRYQNEDGTLTSEGQARYSGPNYTTSAGYTGRKFKVRGAGAKYGKYRNNVKANASSNQLNQPPQHQVVASNGEAYYYGYHEGGDDPNHEMVGEKVHSEAFKEEMKRRERIKQGRERVKKIAKTVESIKAIPQSIVSAGLKFIGRLFGR